MYIKKFKVHLTNAITGSDWKFSICEYIYFFSMMKEVKNFEISFKSFVNMSKTWNRYLSY